MLELAREKHYHWQMKRGLEWHFQLTRDNDMVGLGLY